MPIFAVQFVGRSHYRKRRQGDKPERIPCVRYNFRTYARAGTYRADLIGVGEGSDVALGSLTVIVTD